LSGGPDTREAATADVDIRHAVASDAAGIHELVVELARASGQQRKIRSRPEHFLKYGFGAHPAFNALVAEAPTGLIGLSLYFYNFSSWRGELGVYVQDLVVVDSARGSGLGRKLMAATARDAARHGATHLRLSVERSNDAAIRFYHQVGLRASTDECIYQADGNAFRALAEAP
jgi:ribosomal protein S18 acetylase RimI-like enzyme